MPRGTARRDEVAEAATDYVLDHGLVGLSLRPMAAELGTSDRMLLYHFDGKDDLVSTVLRVSSDRAVAVIRALAPPSHVRQAVLDLWVAVTSPGLDRCQRMYVEAAALGLLGREPYVSVVREANALWIAALADYLTASGMPRDLAPRAVLLMDAAMMGFQLDVPLHTADSVLAHAVADLADAVAAIATGRATGQATGQGSA
jgi:AcrR family transcriptional regulator